MTGAPTPRRPRRRDLILDAAARLFAQRGYAVTGIDDIGAAAGITGPGVYRHFASKEELFKALMQRAIERLMLDEGPAPPPDEPPEDALHRLIDSLAESVVSIGDLATVIWSEQSHLDPTTQAWVAQVHRLRVLDWLHVLSRLDPARTDAEHVTMVNAVYGMMLDASYRTKTMDKAHLRELLRGMAERSLRPRPRPRTRPSAARGR